TSDLYPLSLPDALPICAAFYSSGGYHHHLATNVWNSRGAGQRSRGAAGLAGVELLADAANHDRLAGVLAAQGADPWGTPFTVSRSEEHTSELQSRENLV